MHDNADAVTVVVDELHRFVVIPVDIVTTNRRKRAALLLCKGVGYSLFNFKFSLRHAPGGNGVLERAAAAASTLTGCARRRSSTPRVVVQYRDD